MKIGEILQLLPAGPAEGTNFLWTFTRQAAGTVLRKTARCIAYMRGVRHSAEVEAESLYEAAIARAAHTISLQKVERWLGEATMAPSEAGRKAKLKTLTVRK